MISAGTWSLWTLTLTVGLYALASGIGRKAKTGPNLDKAIIIPGDIIFGGLFPMHEVGTGGEMCGAIKAEKGIQRVEAMLYAIDLINDDPELLPGVKLGAHILDTCQRDTYALEQSLEFIKPYMSTMDGHEYQCSDGRAPKVTLYQPVAGVIGAAASPVSIMVANMLRLFKIPQISYASTGIELSDKTRFGFFSRVVPPDTFQAQALVDVVRRFGWTYVSTLADEGNYGEKGIAAFETLAQKSGICISKSLKIPRDASQETFTRILGELRDSAKARAVVMFVDEDNGRRLVNATIALRLTDAFYWLASDSWGAKTAVVKEQEWAAEGAVTILPERKILSGYDKYFKRLNPENNLRNPWFIEFWESQFNCVYFRDKTTRVRHTRVCSGEESIAKSKHDQEGVVPFVVDAVFAMAHAIHRMIRDTCNGRNFCERVDPPDGTKLLAYIRNTTFIGIAGNRVEFNANGDAKGRYTIFQYQRRPNGRHDYTPIGNWTDTLSIDMSLTQWKHLNRTIPVSVCSEPCQKGQVKKTEGLDTCCWVCIQCLEYETIVAEECIPCPNGTFPNAEKTECVELDVDCMSFDSPWAAVPIVFSSVGIVSVVCVFVVFVKYNSTPVIMASGRELCYVLMAGMLMCYLMTFVMVSRPTVATCALFRIGLGLSMSVCYAALFTKTNRISRIFNRGLKAMVKRPSYTSPRSQLAICLCLVSVQVIGAVTWVAMDLPHTVLTYPDRRSVVLRCRCSNVSIMMSLMYNMFLILLCTIYAFKTRKIPENFNETKYIAFTMYSTCIVWLAFVSIYFGTDKGDFKIQVTALCMTVSISASVALACLFVPKVYIALFQPHKNVRHGAKTSRPFFGCPQTSALNSLDVTNPTGLAMLIAQGTGQLKTQSELTRGNNSGSRTDERDACIKCESLKDDLDSAAAEGSELETNL